MNIQEWPEHFLPLPKLDSVESHPKLLFGRNKYIFAGFCEIGSFWVKFGHLAYHVDF